MRVLESLEVTGEGADATYRCYDCKAVLGPASEDYKSLAGKFDEPMSYGQPAGRGPESSEFVLRHYVCMNCGGLFEVDMTLKDDPAFRSIDLSSTDR